MICESLLSPKILQALLDKQDQINYAEERVYQLTEEKESLETALRALCAELDRRGIAAEVVSTAQHSGLIGKLGFWHAPKKIDVIRLTNDINQRYSKEELAIIKTILGE